MTETKDKMVEDHSVEEVSEEKTGLWIAYMKLNGDAYYECSECGCISTKYLEKCPDYNAKMTN